MNNSVKELIEGECETTMTEVQFTLTDGTVLKKKDRLEQYPEVDDFKKLRENINSAMRADGFHFRSERSERWVSKHTPGKYTYTRVLRCDRKKKKMKKKKSNSNNSTPQEENNSSAPQEENNSSTPQEESNGSTPQKKSNRKTRTKRNTDCNSYVTFSWKSDAEPKCWEVTGISTTHVGHWSRKNMPIILSEEMAEKVKDMKKKDMISNISVKANVGRCENIALTTKQINNAAQQIEQDSSSGGHNEALVQALKKSTDMIGLILFDVYIDGVQIAGQRYYMFLPDSEEPIKFSECSETSSITLFDILHGNIDVSQYTRDDPAIEGRGDGVGLLPRIIAFVSVDQFKMALRFPENIYIDATCKTNSSNRPFIYVLLADSENKTITGLNILSLDEKKVTYRTILETCIWRFFGRKFAKRVRTVVSDGASEITDSIDELIREKFFNKKCRRILCYWHAVVSTLRAKVSLTNARMKSVHAIMQMVMVRVAKQCLTPAQFDLQISRLKEWMKQVLDSQFSVSEETKLCFMQALDFVLLKKSNWALCFNRTTLNFGKITTSRAEGENSVLKKMNVGIKTDLANVLQAITIKESSKNWDQLCSNDYLMNTVPIDSLTDDPLLEGEINLSARLTTWGNRLLENQISQANGYKITKDTCFPHLSWVLQKSNGSKVLLRNQTGNVKLSYTWVPISNKYRVTLKPTGQFQCSCGFFERFLIPCRHVIFCNGGKVSWEDVAPRWNSVYLNGLLDPILDNIYEESDRNMLPSCHLDIEALNRLGVEDDVDEQDMDVDVDGQEEDIGMEDIDMVEPEVVNLTEEEKLEEVIEHESHYHKTKKIALEGQEVVDLINLYKSHADDNPELRELIQQWRDINQRIMKTAYDQMPAASKTGLIRDAVFIRNKGRQCNKRHKSGHEGKGGGSQSENSVTFLEDPKGKRGKGRPPSIVL